MSEETKFYVVDKRVLPEIFVKVMKVKSMMESGAFPSVSKALETVGISRTAYYKYKDHIFETSDSSIGKTVIIALGLMDEKGVLSNVLNVISSSGANILTINQTIPINKIANVTVSISVGEPDISSLMEEIAAIEGVIALKIIARE
ncbi:MAG TPA: ACT domain-containing protein [Lachnospiraceae bacterium]|nr:ACT domain-containing protein [Lachnospiraceae bacterium]